MNRVYLYPAFAAFILFCLLITLSACGTMTVERIIPAPDPMVIVRNVDVPVAVDCSPNIAAEPIYPDTDDAIKNAPFPGAEGVLRTDPANLSALDQVSQNLTYRAKLIAAGRGVRMVRIKELTAALNGCRGH